MYAIFVIFNLIAFSSAQYNFTLGRRNLLLSWTAYCGGNINSAWSCYWCQQVPGVSWVGNFGVSSSSVFGYVAIVENTVVVVWRGTDNIDGWIKDANFKHVPYPGVSGATVHQGFYTGVQQYAAAVNSLVSRAFSRCPTCGLSTMGHSLGAALGTLSALSLKASYPSYSIDLYTYGSPRVGNRAFARYAVGRLSSWRMTNMRDPVPHLPLKVMDYYHLTREIWRKSNSSYIYCTVSDGEDSTCIDSIVIQNPFDHGTYMGIDVLEGIPHGCLWIDPGPKVPITL